jgi:hypothetical protein
MLPHPADRLLHMHRYPERVAAHGDGFAPVLGERQSLRSAQRAARSRGASLRELPTALGPARR